MTKSTSGGGDQFETSPDAIEPELRTALCERRQTDRLKTNYSIDNIIINICMSCCYINAKRKWKFDHIYFLLLENTMFPRRFILLLLLLLIILLLYYYYYYVY